MKRFLMKMEDSLDLVEKSTSLKSSGSIFVKKSPAAKIITLARVLIKIFNSKSKIKEELSTIQKLTKGDNLVTVVKNIFSYDTEDEWYAKGKQTIKNGSPTSAHLIWLQCQNSPKLNLKEVFLFELNLAIQITRQGDFKEGVRALIIDKDNTPDWKFDSIENVSQDWVKEHIKLAWESNPLEDL